MILPTIPFPKTDILSWNVFSYFLSRNGVGIGASEFTWKHKRVNELLHGTFREIVLSRTERKLVYKYSLYCLECFMFFKKLVVVQFCNLCFLQKKNRKQNIIISWNSGCQLGAGTKWFTHYATNCRHVFKYLAGIHTHKHTQTQLRENVFA